ncbi:MAG: domain S-box [Chlorobi bacterium]|nr:domain S-box [Chlorobiota bacterium]
MENHVARILMVAAGGESDGIGRALDGLGDIQIVAGPEAMPVAVRRFQPDLVITVASDGADALEHVRAIKDTADVPVVVMGVEDEGARIDALEAGASDALAGSISLREMRARVAAWLRASVAPRDIPRPTGVPDPIPSEQIFREQEERLRVALLASGTGTYRWDIGNDVIVWDEGMDRLFGAAAGEDAHAIADFIAHVHPDDRERVQLAMECSVRERTNLDVEFRVLRSDGGVIWLADKGRLMEVTPGIMTGACVDITERRSGEVDRAELLVLEREARAKAERTGDRIARLQAVTSALSVALTPLQVADVIIDLGIGAFGAAAGSVSMLTDDGEMLEVVRAKGYSKIMLSSWRRMPMNRSVPLTDCIRTRQVIIVSGRTERTRLFPDVFRSEHLQAHHGIAAIPLMLADRPVGAIGLSFSDGWEFTDEDHAFMRALAQQCVQALERARLYEAERHAHLAAEMRWRESVRLADINRDLAASIELSEVISTICRAARELTGADGAAFIIREGNLVYYADENAVAPLWKGSRFPITACVSGWSILNRQAVAMEDVFNDARVPKELYRSTFVRSLAMVPVRANDPLGAIGVYWGGNHRTTDHEVILLNALADAATIALINAQLYEQTRNAKIEAEAANRMKDEFLATVSHEIRTPLNAILGWAQILRTGDLDAETTERALETVERNAKAQAQLIDDILDISRIITGKIHLEARPVDLDPIIGATVESMRPAAAAKSIHIRMVADRLAGPVMGDPNRLQQVIWNLLSNAIKFTPAGGEVEVRLERDGGRALIVVSDTGQGISPEFMPYVFDRFRQADGTITRKHGGLGLGLAIVRHLLDLHGGTVRAESAGPGEGSTFTVALPIVRLPERADPAGAAPDIHLAEASTLHGVRIVVVDDEPDTLEMLSTTLRQSGATVSAVSSAARALMAIEHSMPDLLVSDIGMPDEDGYSLIRKVRGLSGVRWKDLPAVALTAYAGAEDRRRAIEAGYQRHVTKPVEPAELITVIASLINGRG